MSRSVVGSVKIALESPWKVINHLTRIVVLPWARLVFAFNGIRWGRDWQLFGVPIVQRHRRSYMHFGDGLQLRSTRRSNPLGVDYPVMLSTFRADSSLRVGRNFQMSGGSICASERIEIGDNVMVGARTTIVDSDFHPLSRAARSESENDGATAPVIIEDDVFIGSACIVLKGVILGKGCVIGAGSVVTKSVPAGMVAAGNPARVLGDVRFTQPVRIEK